jgi:hypothetical protein
MDFIAFKDWALLGLVGGGLYLLLDVLKEMKNSLIGLNEKIAVIIERTNNHEERLEKLEAKDA